MSDQDHESDDTDKDAKANAVERGSRMTEKESAAGIDNVSSKL